MTSPGAAWIIAPIMSVVALAPGLMMKVRPVAPPGLTGLAESGALLLPQAFSSSARVVAATAARAARIPG